jgi:hypothetical protein
MSNKWDSVGTINFGIASMKGREKQKWYFNSLVESLESTEVGGHELVKELKETVALLFDVE